MSEATLHAATELGSGAVWSHEHREGMCRSLHFHELPEGTTIEHKHGPNGCEPHDHADFSIYPRTDDVSPIS